MKNRLEDEYRQLMQNETPDLWERISAGIDAKIAADGERKKTAENVEIGQQVKSKNRVITFVKKYSLPLVACIAAILCVPLMLTGFLRMAGGAKSETAAADMVVTESGSMIAEAPAEQYFEEVAAEEAVFEEVALEEAAEEEAVIEEVMEEAPAEEASDNVAMMSDSKADTEKFATTESAVKESNDLSGNCREDQNTENFIQGASKILTVISFSAQEGVLNEGNEKGTIYYLMTEEEGECSVFAPSESAFVIDLDQQLKILVSPGNDDYDYVFVEIAD